MNKNKTLFINMFCGPSGSKTTTALGVQYQLKKMHINSEYIPEYAKELVWANRFDDLKCQPYVTSKQFYYQYKLDNKVDFAVVDSPIILGIIYSGFGSTENWKAATIDHFNMFDNLNIVLNRNLEDFPFIPIGRMQTQEEAIIKDKEIEDLLFKENIPSIKMAKMPLKETTEAIANLAFYTKYAKSGDKYYGLYHQEEGQKLFVNFTDDLDKLEKMFEFKQKDKSYELEIETWIK